MDNFYAVYIGASHGNAGVTSLNGLNGALTLVGGPGITITPAGNTITISSTGMSSTLTQNHIFVGNASNVAADVPMTGDVNIAFSAGNGVTSLVATTNSTITTLSSLSLPTTQLSGQLAFAQLPTIPNNTVIGRNAGGSGVPTFLNASNVLNMIGTSQGDILYRGASAWTNLPAGTLGQFLKTQGAGQDVVWADGNAGTVTSVAMSVPSFLSVSGSPITTSGTLAVTLATQSANTIFAGPTSGGAATPTFRALVTADIPALPYASSTLTSAHIFVGNGSNAATDVAVSGDLTLANTGAFTIANLAVTNAKIANSTIDLTAKVTGILPVANGGTSLATLTANNVILGNGTSAPTFVAPGTSGNVLTSNGTTWTSATPSGGSVALSSITAATTTNTIANANNAQVWNWDTLTTQTAMKLASSTVTSGTILNVTNSFNSITSVGDVVSFSATGASNRSESVLKLSHAGGDGGANVYGLLIDLSNAGGSNVAGIRIQCNGNGSGGTAYGQQISCGASDNNGQVIGLQTTVGSANASSIGTDISMGSNAHISSTVLKTTHGNTASGYAIDANASSTGTRELIRLRNTVTAANNSGAGVMFTANRTGTTNTDIAEISGLITDITAGAYKGALVLKTANNAAPTEAMRIQYDGSLLFPYTNTAGGTTGDQTINKISGSVNFATSVVSSTVTVTNSLVTANSYVMTTIMTDGTGAVLLSTVPTAGSFTIKIGPNSSECRVGFFVINQ